MTPAKKNPPTLGFVCGDCGHGMTPVCHACKERDDDEQNAAWLNQHNLDAEREREEREYRRSFAGVTELEERFETAVKIEQDYDEDGSTGGWSATIHLPGFEIDGGSGSTAELAVKNLQHEMANELRAVAGLLESPDESLECVLVLPDVDLTTILYALAKQHGDPERGKAAVALTEKLCRLTGLGRDEVRS